MNAFEEFAEDLAHFELLSVWTQEDGSAYFFFRNLLPYMTRRALAGVHPLERL